MPYKTKKNRAAYQKKYRDHRTRQLKAVKKALANGNVESARLILDMNPKIHIKKRRKNH